MGNDRSQMITYNQFIHEFLLGDHIESIRVNERGRVLVTIKEDFQGEDGWSYTSHHNETPQYYTFHIPEIVPFMTEVETIQLEQGKTHNELVHVNYQTPIISRRMMWNGMNIAFLILIGLTMIPRKGGMNNMMSKAMGIEPKSIEIVKNTGVEMRDGCECR